MKQKLQSLIFVLTMMCVSNTMASSHSEVSPSGHTIYYEIVNNTAKVVPAVGIGIHNLSASRYPGLSGNVILPDSITYNGVKKAVTAIDDLSFCSCTSLVTIILPSGLETIGSYAFYNCSSLTSISIPNTVTMVDTYAFKGCQSMSSVTLSNAVNTWGAGVFQGCSSISSCVVPEGITQIGLGMFCDCHQLENVSLPSTLISIGQAAFENCFEMSNISLPNSLETIQPYAFVNCTTLTSILIPASVISIASTAFSGCISLSTIQVSPENTTYDSRQNCNAIIETATNKLVRAGIETTIPEGITSIGEHAISFTFTNENGTGCANIPTSIVIPSSVTTIGYNTLNCYEKIFFKPTTPPSLFNNNLENYYTMCYVPCESYDQYRNSLGPNVFISLKSFYYDVEVLPDDIVHGNCNIITYDDDIPIGCDSSTIIEATSNYGYHFERWSNGRLQSRDTLTITSDTSITAIFHKNNYYVLGLPNYEDRGSVTGSDTVEYLDSVTLSAIHNYGYHFVRWSDFSTDNPYTVLANQNKELTAIFAPNTYEVTVGTTDSSNGVARGGGLFDYQSLLYITAIPAYGYHFEQWTDGDITNPRSITLTQDTSFVAQFYRNIYHIYGISNNGNMGVVTGSDSALYQDSILLTATSNYGYHFISWNDGNISNPRIVDVTRDSLFTAYFDYNQYNIMLDVDTIIHGNVAGDGVYSYLTEQIISATANYGYHFVQWNDGDTANPRIIMLTQDTSFSALFERNSYTVSVLSDDTVKGYAGGDATMLYLDSVTISAISNYGYHFAQWNDGSTENPRIIQVTANQTYIAQFDNNQYSIALDVDALIHGTVIGTGLYNYLSELPITAIANYGYHFSQWSDGDTNNPRMVTLTQDTSFTALFAKNYYTLTLQNNDTTLGTIVGGGTYDYLDTILLVATAAEHHHFVRWDDGNTDNPRQYVVIGDTVLTAIFAIDTHHVSVVSNNIAYGNAIGDGDFEYGTPATVTATAYSGYRFARWSNGDTHNPYTFAVLQDIELTAIFEDENEGIDDVETINAKIYTHNGKIVVEATGVNDVWLYDESGRLIQAIKQSSNRTICFDAPASGTYMIKIGDYPACKVVVIK